MEAVVAVFLELKEWPHRIIDDLLFFNIQLQMICIGLGKMKTAEAHSQVVKYLAQFQAMLERIFARFEIMELLEYM